MKDITLEHMESEGRNWAEAAAREPDPVRAELDQYLKDTNLVEKLNQINQELEKIIALNENK